MKCKSSVISENFQVELVQDLYKRNKTENIPKLTPQIDINNGFFYLVFAI